jgi:predicted LPLAT superfamily acyltransferase
MISDTEIKSKGVQILATHLGDVEMERFIALIVNADRHPELFAAGEIPKIVTTTEHRPVLMT